MMRFDISSEPFAHLSIKESKTGKWCLSEEVEKMKKMEKENKLFRTEISTSHINSLKKEIICWKTYTVILSLLIAVLHAGKFMAHLF